MRAAVIGALLAAAPGDASLLVADGAGARTTWQLRVR